MFLQYSKSLVLLILLALSIPAKSQQLEVYLDYKRFSTPDFKGILEIYLQFNAASAQLLKNDKGEFHAKVEVLQVIKQADKIVDYKKFIVESPKMQDTMIVDFIDQKRFLLNPGIYELEIQFKDLHLDSANTISSNIPFTIVVDSMLPYFSDIQPIERFSKSEQTNPFTKSGYDVFPYVDNYYGPEIDKLAFYAELYNVQRLGEAEKLVVFQYLEDRKTGQALNEFSKFTKYNAKPILPVLNVIDISKLMPGDYSLVLEARNAKNEIIVRKKWNFQRNNIVEFSLDDILKLDVKATFVEKIHNQDSINEFISCLRPIALPNEMIIIDTIVRGTDFHAKKQFFYSFWLSRNASQPEYAWMDYKKAVANVQVLFGTQIKRGYMTDRGATFLKFGAPDYVQDRANEPSSYPYQIWQYKKVDKYNNKRFIFYMPDLVTNDYVLLHSDVPGQLRNLNWQKALNSRNNKNTNVDDRSTPGQWGNNSEEFFRNPR